ncbi:MAG: acylneuraminate cytidylyltransferase family protein [Bacteroidales bacterium]|jgi:CMP-N,N'-diacetyllegionaminic acid synthase|nr:acylneuraminate cytidylyltransferase family protein [Bacteroidales bacterium]
MEIKDTLFIIPARGGSKGLPRKNILPLAGKPMICYTIDAARGVTSDENICVSTDDAEIIQVVEDYGLKISFIRPTELATDIAGSREVILHAIDFYKNQLGTFYSKVCLLQPTSPLRTAQHIREAFELWNDDLDMVVSVKEANANPYYNLFEEDKNGFLKKSKDSDFTRRQDAPKVWEYNGAIYIISTDSIQSKPFSQFKRIDKYVMSETNSVDIDNKLDWFIAEKLLNQEINL